MTLDERIAEAEREIREAWDDRNHAKRDMDAIYRARLWPARKRHLEWQAELDRLRALKSDAAEGER